MATTQHPVAPFVAPVSGDLTQRLAIMAQQITQNMNAIEVLRQNTTALQSSVATLNTEVTALQTRVTSLEARVTALEAAP